MRRRPWLLVLMLLVPHTSSALQLRWSTGSTELSFTSATRCTLVVQADASEGRLPAEWRLLWVADSCDIQPLPRACEEHIAQITSVTSPTNLAELAENRVDAQFCSSGSGAASTAWFVFDVPPSGRGKLKVVALDPTDPDSNRVLQSQIVTFNGGSETQFPPVVLRTNAIHQSTTYELTAIGAGLASTTNISLVAPDRSWDLPLDITSQSDTAIAATAAIAAHVPATLLQVDGDVGLVAMASLGSDPPPPQLEPESACQDNFIEDVYPPDEIQPKDFAFVPGGWTAAGSWTFHLFYIRQNQFTKLYHGGLDFTEKNLGHAVSNDLHAWTVLDTAALEVRSGEFDSKHVWAPHVVRRGLTYYMFYTGVDGNNDQRIGLATSTDLVNWAQGDVVFEVPSSGWEDPNPTPTGEPYFGKQQLRDPFVMEDPSAPGDWLMYYVTVARDFSPGMVVGVARSDGDFATWSNTFPLWATLHRWPSATSGRVESAHAFLRNGAWWLFYTANGDTVYGVSNPTSPTDEVTANWTPAQKLRALVPPSEATAYNFWHATEYLEISAANNIRYLAAFNDANESISYTQMDDASPYLFTGQCPSATGVGELVADAAVPRLLLTGMLPARSRVGLRIELPARTLAKLAVYDVLGRRVKTLMDGELPAGATELSWDGRDATGALVGSGVYFACLTAAGNRHSVRVPLMR